MGPLETQVMRCGYNWIMWLQMIRTNFVAIWINNKTIRYDLYIIITEEGIYLQLEIGRPVDSRCE